MALTPSSQVKAGRLESTMQNLADALADRFDMPQTSASLADSQLSTFMMYNMRRKVTSSAKKRRQPGSTKIAQTPDGSLYDVIRNAWQILQRCSLEYVPEVNAWRLKARRITDYWKNRSQRGA